MTGGRSVLVVVAATCALTLASCTDDPAPPAPTPATAPATPTTTTTATPTPTPPPEPTPEHTAQGATEFVRHFWALYNYAFASYDTSPIAARSDPSCRFCASVVQQIGDLRKSGTRVQGYVARAGETSMPSADVGDRALVVVVVTQEAGTAIPASGTPRALPATPPTRFSFALRWDGGAWKIHGVDFEKVTP